jgi:hypothetical protein
LKLNIKDFAPINKGRYNFDKCIDKQGYVMLSVKMMEGNSAGFGSQTSSTQATVIEPNNLFNASSIISGSSYQQYMAMNSGRNGLMSSNSYSGGILD